jgi:hypothetical protein
LRNAVIRGWTDDPDVYSSGITIAAIAASSTWVHEAFTEVKTARQRQQASLNCRPQRMLVSSQLSSNQDRLAKSGKKLRSAVSALQVC